MKKLFFAIVMLFATSSLMAQVVFDTQSLKEALAKAKAENKLVMVIGSTTWCGPCKMVASQILPTKEAGDYMNPRFVVIKYNVDIADPDDIQKTYGIRAYPTFVFLNGDGVEVARMLGGAKDAAGFIERVKTATAPENSFAARKAAFDKNPSLDYVEFLNDCYMNDEAAKVFDELFSKRSVKDNFDEESIKYYTKNVRDINSPVVQYMLNNPAEVKAVMGENKYNEFISSRVNNTITPYLMGRSANKDMLDKNLAIVAGNKALQTPYTTFVADAKDAVFAKDFDGVLKIATKSVKKADSKSRQAIMNCVMNLVSDNKGNVSDDRKAAAVKFLTQCSKLEKDPKSKEFYETAIKRLTDPDFFKKSGAVPAMRMM